MNDQKRSSEVAEPKEPASTSSPSPFAERGAGGEVKRCSKCGEVKPLAEFSKNRTRKDGLNFWCRDCRRAYYESHREQARVQRGTYYQQHREQARVWQRAYREQHRERELARQRARYQQHREQVRLRHCAYREQHHAQVLEGQRAYREQHRGQLSARQRAYNEQNRTQRNASAREYKKQHPEVRRKHKHARRSRFLNAEGSFTANDIKGLYESQTACCAWCSQPLNGKYHIDHVIPLSRGGSNWPDNLVLACEHCNKSKCNKLPYSEWQPPNPLRQPADETF